MNERSWLIWFIGVKTYNQPRESNLEKIDCSGNKQSIQSTISFIKQKKINFLFFDFIPFISWIEWDGIEEKYYNSNSSES